MVRIGLPRNLLALFQTVEYLRAFLMARLAWSRLNADHHLGRLRAVPPPDRDRGRGLRHDTVGEDFELIVKIHRHLRERKQDYSVTFIPEPVCWTEAPES